MSVGVLIASLANGVIFNQITVEARGALTSVAQPAEGVSVTVYDHEPGYVPTGESTRADVFEDEFLTVAATQPLSTDVNGNVPGYVATGQVLDLLCTGGPLPGSQVLTINTQVAAFTTIDGGSL